MEKFWRQLTVKSFVFIIALSISTQAFGQQLEKRKPSGPRRQLATIVFAGLGGAILGLSTLSFYGRPQDQLSNIAIGFAVGVIAGTIYVTFRSATTHDYIDENQEKPPGTGSLLKALPPLVESGQESFEAAEVSKLSWSPVIYQSGTLSKFSGQQSKTELGVGALASINF